MCRLDRWRACDGPRTQSKWRAVRWVDGWTSRRARPKIRSGLELPDRPASCGRGRSQPELLRSDSAGLVFCDSARLRRLPMCCSCRLDGGAASAGIASLLRCLFGPVAAVPSSTTQPQRARRHSECSRWRRVPAGALQLSSGHRRRSFDLREVRLAGRPARAEAVARRSRILVSFGAGERVQATSSDPRLRLR